MITKENICDLVEYFEVAKVPENLELFVKKLNLIKEELLLKEEMQTKINKIHEELINIDSKKEE